jgi:PAS domain S-box-containing protein
MNFLERLSEYRRGPAREHLEPALAGGHVEYEVQYPDGNWIFVNYLPVKDADGNIRQISVSFRDVTEKKKLQSEMEVLALLARETVNAVCILDPVGEMLWINEGFVRLTGYSREELIGGTSRAFLHGAETDPATVERATYCRQNGLPFTEEFRIYSKQGKKICTRVQGQAIGSIKGNVPNYFCIVTDITEEKKILEELEVLSMVAKETNNSVMIFDRFTRQVVWVNEGFTRLTGYSADDIIGKDPALVLSGAETDMELMKEWDGKIRNNESYSGDMIVYLKDGRRQIHHVHSQPFRGQRTDRSWYFAVGSDITERRRLEEERLQTEVEQQQKITHVILESRELERNELGRELHDNINQLLAAIHLQISFSLKNFPNCKPVLEQCRRNILDAMGEIRQLSHKMVLPRFSEKELPEVLQSLADNYSYAMRIKLETDTWNENSVGARIKEVFFRIAQEQLSNIYKHAKATQVKIIIVCDASNARLAVEDNGIGFDTTTTAGGIGLGNIRSRVEACNGVSELISAPGKGCALLVRIPLDAA